jgi:ATP-dependent Clp protease adaptor protein ClpS
MATTVIEPTISNDVRLMPMYKVLLHNDDKNAMDFVVSAIVEVFKYEIEKAVNLMLEAHKGGVVLCKTEPLETAELHQEQLQSFGLTATIEPDA